MDFNCTKYSSAPQEYPLISGYRPSNIKVVAFVSSDLNSIAIQFEESIPVSPWVTDYSTVSLGA